MEKSITQEKTLTETRWTDASIRWPEDKPKTESDDEEEECGYMDPFKDPDPFTVFSFKFNCPGKSDGNHDVVVDIRGYKTDADEVWDSTGLTLWRASEFLCEYQSKHLELFEGKRVLELGSGLGLNGILAWRMTYGSKIFITDGDTDALVHLRENVDRNRPLSASANDSDVFCHQLIWGQETSISFLEHHAHNKKFDVLLASDIIYAKIIIQPLWETVTTLLSRNGKFVMAFAKRKVPISIDFVLESAKKAGFAYDLEEEDAEEGIWVYLFRFQNDDDNK